MFYQFITGPLLWLTFGVFFLGLTVRVVNYIRGLDWQADRVAYRTYLGLGIKGALQSIIHWLIPFGSVGWRAKPLYTIIFFVFHLGLVVTPLFLQGHAVLLKERWGINWPTIPMLLADLLTIGVMVTTVCIAIRRFALPEVRIVSTAYDYFLLLFTVTPFATGFLSVYQAPNPGDIANFWIYAHILSGEFLLMAIPFTKLFHILGYFLSRGQLGMDFGIKRAYKTKGGFAW